MPNVKVIAPQAPRKGSLRVAAYCRVSSDSKDQLHSYAAQIRAYTEEIARHDGWELIDVYADEGLTGTRMDKREDFNRMMADCRKGKIDRILVKSVSRFARNTKDCLSTLRELSGIPLWYPEYKYESTAPEKVCPQLYYRMDYWQYTNKLKVDGIGGNVDGSLRFYW